jgi:Domain of unknown function (DUF1922)
MARGIKFGRKVHADATSGCRSDQKKGCWGSSDGNRQDLCRRSFDDIKAIIMNVYKCDCGEQYRMHLTSQQPEKNQKCECGKVLPMANGAWQYMIYDRLFDVILPNLDP